MPYIRCYKIQCASHLFPREDPSLNDNSIDFFGYESYALNTVLHITNSCVIIAGTHKHGHSMLAISYCLNFEVDLFGNHCMPNLVTREPFELISKVEFFVVI